MHYTGYTYSVLYCMQECQTRKSFLFCGGVQNISKRKINKHVIETGFKALLFIFFLIHNIFS